MIANEISAISCAATPGMTFAIYCCSSGATFDSILAEIYAWVGEHDEAFLLFDHLLAAPDGLTVPQLKLDPVWDPLRADPHFQKLCEEKQK